MSSQLTVSRRRSDAATKRSLSAPSSDLAMKSQASGPAQVQGGPDTLKCRHFMTFVLIQRSLKCIRQHSFADFLTPSKIKDVTPLQRPVTPC